MWAASRASHGSAAHAAANHTLPVHNAATAAATQPNAASTSTKPHTRRHTPAAPPERRVSLQRQHPVRWRQTKHCSITQACVSLAFASIALGFAQRSYRSGHYPASRRKTVPASCEAEVCLLVSVYASARTLRVATVFRGWVSAIDPIARKSAGDRMPGGGGVFEAPTPMETSSMGCGCEVGSGIPPQSTTRAKRSQAQAARVSGWRERWRRRCVGRGGTQTPGGDRSNHQRLTSHQPSAAASHLRRVQALCTQRWRSWPGPRA
jgi:hypothetical protein